VANSGLRRSIVGAVIAATITFALPGTPSQAAPPVDSGDHAMGSTLAKYEPDAARAAGKAKGFAAAAAPPGVPGIDVSHWQGRMDWGAVAANGTKYAYIKATEGVHFVDDEFATNYAGSANAGLLRGAYHFARPNRSSATAQVDFFVQRGGNWANDGRTLPPVLDIEYNPAQGEDMCYGMAGAPMVAWVTEFANVMRDRIGRYPVMYTTRGWWRSCTGNDPGLASKLPLWIAGYNGNPANLPNGWANYAIWQYASSPIDQDAFNGGYEELQALASGDEDAAITTHANAVGGLGAPSGARYAVGDGSARDYANGTVYYTHGTRAWALRGAVLDFYRQQGGPTGFLKFPGTDDLAGADGGRYSHFQGGSVFSSPATGTHEVHGSIRATFGVLGWETFLGYPMTDELTLSDGVGRANHFQRGVIYHTPSTGAREVYGSILDTWTVLGRENSFIGYPTTGEVGTPDNVGRANFFQRGAIYWTQATGAHEVQGSIYNRWAALGYQDFLGYPITGEQSTSDGVGKVSNFQRGAIYWTEGTGANEIYGSIRDTWNGLGAERSYLAYPTTGELSAADGIGRANFFQRGAIYWTQATGAHEVQGSIYNRWAALGWSGSYLGYPTTGELSTADNVGRANFFQRGAIYWSAGTGAWEVQGSIYSTWASLGFQNSRLGYPVGGEFDVAGGRRSNFQGGYITWVGATNSTQVVYY
jgi:uncharacterized protein with LGFP repeats/GH25 family lysozyme M1 (1,4-beta-N-acetylmuramidase)